MPPLQTTYTENMPVGAAGMIANMEETNVITRTANGNIAFGAPVISSGNHNCAIASELTLSAVSSNGVPAPAGATITANPTAVAPAQVGVYTARAVVGGAGTASRWEITAPNGQIIGTALGNTQFVGGGLTFTITDSGTDPVAGEAFNITVTSDEAGDMLGLAVRNVVLGKSSSPDVYAQYDSVGIMTSGVMWVIAGATVVAGERAYWDAPTGRYTNVVTDYPILTHSTSGRFETGGGNGDLVMVAIR